jgi:predicted ATPase
MAESSRQDYVNAERRHAAARDAERRRSATVARLRLATFVAAVAALVWWLGFDGRMTAFLATATLFSIFAALVVVHSRIEEREALSEALRIVNERGVARADRNWDALPDAPPPSGIALDGHPYAIDLDLFGRASLFQWIGPGATTYGTHALASWLSSPADPETVLLRQQAVGELAPLAEWRAGLAARGVLAGASSRESIDAFFDWAEGTTPPLPYFTLVRASVYGLVLLIWVPLLLHLTGVAPNGAWGYPLLASITFSFFTAAPLTKYFARAGVGERTIRQYADLLAHMDGQRFSTPRLVELERQLAADERAHAPQAMRALARILGFADLRSGAALFHFPIQAFTLWDFHCLVALERWRRRIGPRGRGWLRAAGEIDALACLAAIRHDNPAWCFPTIVAGATYRAERLAHPLLPSTHRVPNDVEVGPPGTVLLVTGSNMSGKSTLLRAVGVSVVLAEAGAPVCAVSLRMPPCEIQTSIRVQDSLERGVSYFMAALARLKGVIDAADRDRFGGRTLIYLLDEILQGTNSLERGIAVQAVARQLLDAGAIGAMTTHDLNLASEEPLASHARLVHFTEVVDERGQMSFDYTLRAGLATSRNALRLMKLIGIDVAGPNEAGGPDRKWR